jgi:S-adenosyl methyltransferase
LVCGWPGCPPTISDLPAGFVLSVQTEISVTSAPDHPLQFKLGNASTGRVYNAYAGGRDNFEADRALAGQVVEIAPDAAGRAADLAGFSLAAAVIAADVGQLVDIGAGTPASMAAVGASPPAGDAGAAAGDRACDSVYRVARRINPGIPLVAVDHDPVVLMHLRAEAGDRAVIDVDVRDVAALLRELDAVVDWSQPLGVMLCAVLHFVADHEEYGEGAQAIAEAIISRLVPGSMVAAFALPAPRR